MAGLNAEHVLVGTANQSTSGAILSAPLGTKLPTSATDTIDQAFVSSGYISNDGLQLTPSYNTSDITDWNGNLVRRILTSFTGELTWSELQTDTDALKHAFGDENVTETAATAEHGTQVKVSLGAHLPEARSWIFLMADKVGEHVHKTMIVVPNGQVTAVDAVSFTSGDGVTWPVTLSTYDDGTGTNNSLYIYLDDGTVVAA